MAEQEKAMSKSKGIIFGAESVKAIMAGRKTQTRRLVKLPVGHSEVRPSRGAEAPRGSFVTYWREPGGEEQGGTIVRCPYPPGSLLWVREAWSVHRAFDSDPPRDLVGTEVVRYAADGARWEFARIRNPLHMPRRAARLWLLVEEVRCERLQEISEEDYFAEGLRMPPIERTIDGGGHEMVDAGGWWRREFGREWDHLNGKKAPWSSSPWVWVIRFRPVERSR